MTLKKSSTHIYAQLILPLLLLRTLRKKQLEKMTKIHQSEQSPEYVSIFANQNLLARLNRFIPNSLFIPSKQNIYNISNITYKNKNGMIKKKDITKEATHYT